MGRKDEQETEAQPDPETEQAAAAVESMAGEAAGEDATEGEYQPGGEAEERKGADPESAEVVKTLAAVTFNLVSVRRGDHWNLSKEEADAIGEAGGAVMDKWAPDMKVGPEATLAVTLGMVFIGRIQQDKAIADELRRQREREEAREAEGEAAGEAAGEA